MRVLAKRVSAWAEGLDLLDDNQASLRSGRSTADVVQMMVRVHEDVEDCRWIVEGVDEREWPVAKLLDSKKPYPKVNKSGLWRLLERYGMNGKSLEYLIGLYESTVYNMRGKEGMSEAWVPDRDLRVGCSTSPILFNIYHQVIMCQIDAWRAEQGEALESPGGGCRVVLWRGVGFGRS